VCFVLPCVDNKEEL